jgi:hypothetical protein
LGKPVESAAKDEPSGPPSKEKSVIDLKKIREEIESSLKIVGKISIPLSHLLSLSTIVMLVGIGKILISKKNETVYHL